jgi:hypothetical protein
MSTPRELTGDELRRAYELITEPDSEECAAAGGDPVGLPPLTEEQVDRLVAAAAAAYRGRAS